jgi:predicted transcriptional regulator
VKKTRNVTLSLDEELLRKFRVYAATENKSMSNLMADAINALIDRNTERRAAARRLIERMENAPNLGLGGKIPWTRDELYRY